MSQGSPTPIWLPPIQADLIGSFCLVLIGSNIEKLPENYKPLLTNQLILVFGILISAGLASIGFIALSFALAFCLVNIVRLMPHPPPEKKSRPGKEGFKASGTTEWVTNNKKWFAEKVMNETPIGRVDKEVSTYPID